MTNMQLSDKGRKLIEQREGCVLHVYKDSQGYPTIGVGHLIVAGEHFTTITQAEADDLFKKDSQRFVDNLNRHLTRSVTQDEFDAMVSLSYNIGEGDFNSSTVLRDVNANNIGAASNAFLMWDKPASILGRRYDEYKQFKGLI